MDTVIGKIAMVFILLLVLAATFHALLQWVSPLSDAASPGELVRVESAGDSRPEARVVEITTRIFQTWGTSDVPGAVVTPLSRAADFFVMLAVGTIVMSLVFIVIEQIM